MRPDKEERGELLELLAHASERLLEGEISRVYSET